MICWLWGSNPEAMKGKGSGEAARLKNMWFLPTGRPRGKDKRKGLWLTALQTHTVVRSSYIMDNVTIWVFLYIQCQQSLADSLYPGCLTSAMLWLTPLGYLSISVSSCLNKTSHHWSSAPYTDFSSSQLHNSATLCIWYLVTSKQVTRKRL